MLQKSGVLTLTKESGGPPRGLTYGLALIWGLMLQGGLLAGASTDVPAPSAPTQFLTTPLSFEANVGQVEAPVHYLSRGPGYGVFLTPTEAVLVVQRPTASAAADSRPGQTAHPPVPLNAATLRLQFVGAQGRTAPPIGRDPLPGQSHYFLGNDPSKWHTQVPHYAQVVYEDLYPGIDLIYYGREGQLEYDLVLAPGANPHDIELQVQGAETLTLTPEGHLRIETAVGEVLQHQPVIYQQKDGMKNFIAGAYRVGEANRVSFVIAAYDATRPLYIDPVLSYASYFPSDGLYSLAQDAEGNLYLTGAALPAFPTVNAGQSDHRGFRDAFVSKLDPTGTTLLYSTYLGGSRDDLGRDLAVDATGRASVVGISSSADFPTANALQEQHAGSYDVVVARLSPSGASLEYATYLGGSGEDGLLRGLALALDAQGNAYVSGTTNSSDFPTLQALQPTYGGAVDAFVAKVGSDEPALLYATYLGGTSSEYGGDLAVDGVGQAYVVGTTFSADFPTVNPLQPAVGGERDLFITKLTSDGAAVVYSTYLGGTAQDEGHGLTVDADGQAYVTGHTHSTDYPVVKPVQATLAGGADVVISHLDAAGASLLSSTYVGGRGQDKGVGIAVDASGQAYVTGSTGSADFPITANAAQRTPGMAGVDAFVLKLSSPGTSLLYASYLGGDGDDIGQAITVEGTQTAYVVGTTASSDFPRTAPLQAAPSGGFVAKLSETAPRLADLTITMVDAPEPVERGTPLTYTITVDNTGPDTATGVTVTDTLSARLRMESVAASQGICQGVPVVCHVGTVSPGSQATITITGTPLAAPWTLTNRASVLSELPDPTLSNNSMKLTTEVTAPADGPTADLSLIKNDDTDPATIGAPFRYTLTVSNTGPDTAPEVIVTETVPPEMSVGVATPSRGTCTGSRELICQLGSLEEGATATVTIEVIPTTITTLLSRAQVTSGAVDPTPDNNRDTEATLVQVVPQADPPEADLRVLIDGPPSPATLGEIQEFKITGVNDGPDQASDVMLANNIPSTPLSRLEDFEITKGMGECVTPEDTCMGIECVGVENDPILITCDFGTLQVEEEVELTVKVKLSVGLQSSVGAISGTTLDPNTGNSTLGLLTVVESPDPPPPQSGDGGGSCFIATAAFGSPLAKEVQILRHFRDQFLLPYQAGQLLVRGYYFSSPPLAAFIEQHPVLKGAVRVALWPMVWWAHLTLTSPNLAIGVLLGGLLVSICFLYVAIRVWPSRIGM